MSDLSALRAQFPVFDRYAYLNAGTDGPLAARAVAAARATLELELAEGRWSAHFERRREGAGELRSRYAALLSCEPDDVALTTCTSEGLAIVISGLELGAGDEILTSDEEHPGLLGALQAARDLRGVRVRMAPLAELAAAVGPQTRLIACSHVGWIGGALAPAELAQTGVPVLLDGAQGIGAVPVDVGALGCAFYAGSGQKWLCGPDGLGMLYVDPEMRDAVACQRRGYMSFEDPGAGLDARLRGDARRYDSFSLSAEALALGLAALDVLADAGWERVHARAAELAAELALRLGERGRAVAPRAASTLVAFASADPDAECKRLAAAGVIVRTLPGRGMLRASVGAWNDERDLARLLDGLD